MTECNSPYMGKIPNTLLALLDSFGFYAPRRHYWQSALALGPLHKHYHTYWLSALVAACVRGAGALAAADWARRGVVVIWCEGDGLWSGGSTSFCRRPPLVPAVHAPASLY